MKLEFSEVLFNDIGRRTNQSDAMWGALELRFKDAETDCFLSVEVTLFLPKRPDVTIAELQQSARDRATTILREAVACLEAHGVAELENIAAESAAMEEKRLFGSSP